MKASEFFEVLRDALPTREDIARTLDTDEVKAWLPVANGDHLQAQRVMNHRHVTDMLDRLEWDDSFDSHDLVLFAQLYAALLRDFTQREFPEHRFVVEIMGEELVAKEPNELTVTFHCSQP